MINLKSKSLIDYYSNNPDDYTIKYHHYNIVVNNDSKDEFENIEETEKNAEEICRYLPLKKEKITGSCDILKRIISGDYDDNFIVLNPGDAVTEQMFRFNGR